MKRSRIKGNGSTPTQKRQRPPQGSSRRKVKSSVKFHFDEDISDGGDSDEDVFTSGGKPSATVEMVEEESDNETATEKRVRLAKDLLRSYENEAARDRRSSFDGDDAQDNLDENDPFFNSKDTPQRGITGERQDTAITDAISQRLHDDVRHATGKIFRQCADVLTTCDASEVSNAFHHGHDKAPTCITLSHDESNAWTGSKDCSVIRWDVETGKRIAKYPGRHMTRADRNTKSGKKIHATGHSDEVLAIACTTDGKYVASAGRDSTIRLWDARSNKLLDTFKGHRDIISTLTFQDYTHTLYSGSHDRTVKIWNMTERMYVDTLFGHQAEVTSISCLRKERVVSCGRDRTVRIWKVEEGSQLVCRAKPRAVSLDAISMINDRTYLSGSENGSVSLWSVNKKKPIYNVRDAHSGNWITSTASLAHTDLVASGSSDGALRLWRVDLDDQYLEEVAHLGVPGFINDISFGSSGRILVAAIGREHRLGRWEKMKTSEAKNGIQIVRLPKF